MQITANKAVKLAAEEHTTLGALEEMGFTIVVGDANTSAPAPAVPKAVVVNEELIALVEAVRAKAHTKTKTGKALKTSDGRPKAVLGRNDGIGGFTVIINGSRSSK